MTKVTPAETPDQPDEAAKRAAFCADLHAFANWLAENPWVPLPSRAHASKQLNVLDDKALVAPSLAKVREVATLLGVKTDESLPDRTRATIAMGCVEYGLLSWHKDGRPGEPDERDVELERLRAENAALRDAKPDPSGLGYSREADDPTPVSPARVPLHTGSVVDGGHLVDESLLCMWETGGGSTPRQRCGDPIKWDASQAEWKHADNVWHGHFAAAPVSAE